MLDKLKQYETIGCCGIDCGLCPRFYTEGKSKCPGCFGMSFTEKHPPCSFATCCVKKHELEVCGQCDEFPCKKYDNAKFEKDSFVSHKKMMYNLEFIRKNGVEKYIEEQNIRIKILEKILRNYNDGKSKSLFCLAVTLLDISGLNESITKAEHKIKTKNISENDFKSKSRILKDILAK